MEGKGGSERYFCKKLQDGRGGGKISNREGKARGTLLCLSGQKEGLIASPREIWRRPESRAGWLAGETSLRISGERVISRAGPGGRRACFQKKPWAQVKREKNGREAPHLWGGRGEGQTAERFEVGTLPTSGVKKKVTEVCKGELAICYRQVHRTSHRRGRGVNRIGLYSLRPGKGDGLRKNTERIVSR